MIGIHKSANSTSNIAYRHLRWGCPIRTRGYRGADELYTNRIPSGSCGIYTYTQDSFIMHQRPMSLSRTSSAPTVRVNEEAHHILLSFFVIPPPFFSSQQGCYIHIRIHRLVHYVRLKAVPALFFFACVAIDLYTYSIESNQPC